MLNDKKMSYEEKKDDEIIYGEVGINCEKGKDNKSLVTVNNNTNLQIFEYKNKNDTIKKARAQSLTKEISLYINPDEREEFVNDFLFGNRIDAKYRAKTTSENKKEKLIAQLILTNEDDVEIIDPVEDSKIGYLHHDNFFDAVYRTDARGGEEYKIVFKDYYIIHSMLDNLSTLVNKVNKKSIVDALAANIALSNFNKKDINKIIEQLCKIKFIDLNNDFISTIDKYTWIYKNFSKNKPSNEELYALYLLKDYVLVDNKGVFKFIDINDFEKEYSINQLKIKFMNKNIPVENPNTKRSKTKNPVDIFLESSYRIEYVDVVFDPSCTNKGNVLNLFSGFKYEAKQIIDITMFKNFVKEDLCDGDELKFNVLWAFFSHIIKSPEEKTGICPVMTSPEGAGKSTLMKVMGEIFSGYYMTSKDINHITGQFSKHLEKILLFYGNEVNLTGSALQKFKNIVTEIMTTTEGKGIDAYNSSNYTRFVLDGNTTPINSTGRRWFDIRIEGKKIGNQKFWISLNEHINAIGFYESLMYDLSNFDYLPYEQYLYEAPKFQSKDILDDLIVTWWSQCLQNGTIPYVSYEITHDDCLNITNENKFESYKKWSKTCGFSCKHDIFSFGKEFTKKALCDNSNLEKSAKITVKGRRINSKVYMPLSECKKVFLENYSIDSDRFISKEWQVA